VPERIFSVTRSAVKRCGAVQQTQPLPWSRVRRGALALRSLVANAARRAVSIIASDGAERMARSAKDEHAGQGCGSAYSAIGRVSVKNPQVLQR
jgi:ribosomal protein S7